MSNYNFPATGGVKITFSGRTIGVWCDSTPLGLILVLGELVDEQWLGRWTHGPLMEVDMQAEVTAAGGIIPYLNSFVAAVNAEIKVLFGVTPPPPPVGLQAQLNAALGASFALVAGATAPVFGQSA